MKRRFRQVKLLDMIFLHFKAEFLYPSPSFPFVYMKVNVVPLKVLKWVKHWKWWLLYVLHLWLIKNSEISKCVQRYTNIDFFFKEALILKLDRQWWFTIQVFSLFIWSPFVINRSELFTFFTFSLDKHLYSLVIISHVLLVNIIMMECVPKHGNSIHFFVHVQLSFRDIINI